MLNIVYYCAFEFFNQQSAASEKFENDLDRLAEFRIRLDELKEERKASKNY